MAMIIVTPGDVLFALGLLFVLAVYFMAYVLTRGKR